MSRNLIIVLILLAVVLYHGIATDAPQDTSGNSPSTGASVETTAGTGTPSGAQDVSPTTVEGSASQDRATVTTNAPAKNASVQPETNNASQNDVNAATSITVGDYLPQEANIENRISSFIQDEYFQDKASYLDKVDYFERGMISRDAVLQDIGRYIRRWPQRHFQLVPGSVQVTPKNQGRYVAAFDYTYAVSNNDRKLTGNASAHIALVERDGQFYVAGVRETVVRDR